MKMFKKEQEYSDYIEEWLNELQTTRLAYAEPLLDETTVDFIKLACMNLNQDNHVFIMTCEILEHILRTRTQKHPNKVLLICSIITILSKHVGEISDLRPKFIQTFYLHIMGQNINTNNLKLGEMEVFNMLEHKLPLYSKIDDLKLFYLVYVDPMNLRVNLLPICEDLLCLVRYKMRILFYKVQYYYEDTKEALHAFRSIMTNKLYFPAGIILTSIKLTLVKNFVDLDKVLGDLTQICNIHEDHLRLLMINIYDIVKDKM